MTERRKAKNLYHIKRVRSLTCFFYKLSCCLLFHCLGSLGVLCAEFSFVSMTLYLSFAFPGWVWHIALMPRSDCKLQITKITIPYLCRITWTWILDMKRITLIILYCLPSICGERKYGK